jgi:hypothetical protein
MSGRDERGAIASAKPHAPRPALPMKMMSSRYVITDGAIALDVDTRSARNAI